MTVFECVLNNLKSNMLFVSPEGFGKTSQFINCYKKIIETLDSVVPIYIDLADAEVISACRNNSMYSYALSKYCGVVGDLSNGIFRLKELFQKESKYSFVVFVDHFESAIKNEIYDTVSCDISELSKFENCCTIVASTYYDDRIFHSFKRFDFLALSKEIVVSYINSKSQVVVTEGSVPERQFNVLTVPWWLYEYGEMLGQGKIDLFAEFESDVDLLTKRLDCDIDEILNEFKTTCELAFYCVKNNSLVVPHPEIKRVFSNDAPLHKRFLIALKHLTNGKNEDTLEKFNRISKKYGYGQLCGEGETVDKINFAFSKQVYVDYFAAEYCYNLLSGCDETPGKLEDLNCFLLNDEVSRMVALKIKKSEQREIIINVLDRIATFNKNLYKGEMPSLENSKFLYLTANLLNINFYVNRSFENANFSYLDLRLCNFIGKNCSCADFTKSFVSDECFVPVEPENASLFAVSDNGKFLVSGDKTVLNIRSIDFPLVIDSVLCENEDEFIKVRFVNETAFEAVCKKRVLVVNIADESTHIRDLEQENMIQEGNEKTDNNNFSNYGVLCYLNEKHAVVKSSETSYYGQAYLLFDVKNKKVISQFRFHSHLEIHAIVQRGDEINFLYPNSDKPLKAICYNEKTKEIYRKKYPSMVGRGIAYEDGKRIYFDTDKYDSYLKFYFSHLPTKQREADWIDKENSKHFVISKANCTSQRLSKTIITEKWIYRIYDDLTSYSGFLSGYKKGGTVLYSYEFTTYDLGSNEIWEYCRRENRGAHVNVIKKDDEYRLIVGNSVYSCFVDGDDVRTTFLYNFELNLRPEFVHFIDLFPWEEILKFIIDLYNVPQLPLWDLDDIIRPVVEKIVWQIKTTATYDNRETWRRLVSYYIYDMVHYYNKEKNKGKIPSFEEIASYIKKICFPCDNGIIYYNGNYSCYLRCENGKFIETSFCLGYLACCLRNGVHYIPSYEKYYKSNYYELYDVYKESYYNSTHAPRIPIYDLELFSANTDDTIGLSAVCKDILKKQTTIKTRNMIFTDEK